MKNNHISLLQKLDVSKTVNYTLYVICISTTDTKYYCILHKHTHGYGWYEVLVIMYTNQFVYVYGSSSANFSRTTYCWFQDKKLTGLEIFYNRHG